MRAGATAAKQVALTPASTRLLSFLAMSSLLTRAHPARGNTGCIYPMNIAIQKIYIDPQLNISRGCRAISKSSVKDLSDDIKTNGLMQPVGVAAIKGVGWMSVKDRDFLESEGFEWVLIHGFRRVAACKLAGLTEIKAEPQTAVTFVGAALANLAENWTRDPPNEYDLAVACHALSNTHGIDIDIISLRVNKSKKRVEDLIKIISRVSPDLLEKFKFKCTPEMRRKMLELASIDALSRGERHEKQRKRWAEMEAEEAIEVKPHKARSPMAGHTANRALELWELISDAVEYQSDDGAWNLLQDSDKRLLRTTLNWLAHKKGPAPFR